MLGYEEYSRWMTTSKETLDSARGNLSRGDYNWSCFKAQQAVEFAVKALLYGLGEPPYGHSVVYLGPWNASNVGDYDFKPPSLITSCISGWPRPSTGVYAVAH